jgi:hypothetical protein
MGLPTLAKTWSFNVNNQLPATGSQAGDCKQLMLEIKNLLVGGGWTVVGSSNAVTAGLDAVDRWASVDDVVWNSVAGARSWIVLKNASIAPNYQICIECIQSTGGQNANPFHGHAYVSEDDGFSVGSITARPTAADEYALIGNGRWIAAGTFGACVVHYIRSTDGRIHRIFVIINNTANLALSFGSEASSNSVWVNPLVAYWYAGAGGVVETATIASFHGAAMTRGRIDTVNFLAYMTMEGYAGGSVAGNQTYPDDHSLEWPILPIGLYSATALSRGRKGAMVDLWFGSTAINTGDTYPDDATKQFAQFGDFIIPWNGSTPVTA